MAQVVAQSKLRLSNTCQAPRGGTPNENTPVTSLGTPLNAAELFPPLFWHKYCLIIIIIIIDIIRCSYLILFQLLYNIFNMIEISIVYNNVSSNTL